MHALTAYVPPPPTFPGIEVVLTFYESAPGALDLVSAPRYNYPIHVLLKDYGTPDAVYIHILDVLPVDRKGSYDLLLDYSTQGFLAQYSGPTGKSTVIPLCPSSLNPDVMGPQLWLFAPSHPSLPTDLDSRINLGLDIELLHPLEELSVLSLSEFYDTYSDIAKADTCFDVNNPNPPTG